MTEEEVDLVEASNVGVEGREENDGAPSSVDICSGGGETCVKVEMESEQKNNEIIFV